jgi:hypothetical protein
MVQEMGQEIGFLCSRERHKEISESSKFAKKINKKVATKIRVTCEKT